MKRLLIILLLVPGASTAQTTISNPDGTYSFFYYSPYGSTIIYPDGSHAIVVDQDSTAATIVYPDFSFSRIFYDGPVTTIVHSDFSYSVMVSDAAQPVAPSPERDSASLYNDVPATVKSAADTGYILLSDDPAAAVRPNPGEAHYILLNDLVDTVTMHSNRSKSPGERLPDTGKNTASHSEPVPAPTGEKQTSPATETRYFHPPGQPEGYPASAKGPIFD
ncbi:hypothetical protein [Niabella aurantiaca]|uniref:hypothetical protein n=1 Tax=Niabella aurantiaca TaxID=379900 RepID=UPI000373352B|nr:hypothetical protein [Niabella aurantiaca]